jgi:hypothetical protein
LVNCILSRLTKSSWDVNQDDSRLRSDVVVEGFYIHPFRLSLEGECGQLRLSPMGWNTAHIGYIVFLFRCWV